MGDVEKAASAGEHEDESNEEEEGGEAGTRPGRTTSLMQNPAVLAAMQNGLGKLVGQSSGYVASLPAPVRRRIKALKKLQMESTNIEAKFYEEIHALECKYHELYTPLYAKRTLIANGEYEPTEEECEWPSEDEDEEEEELAEGVKEKAKVEDVKAKSETAEKEGDETKGVPGFWLTIFNNVEMLAEMIQENDAPLLELLEDVKITFSEKDPMGFTLHFHFAKNEFFTNSVLTKQYDMKCLPDPEDPFSFEGPEIFKCVGCPIDWLPGKNLTVKQVKKKQKHKSKGSVRTVTKQVKADSFFNFFEPPTIPDDPTAEVDEDTQALLTADFEIGHYIRERIVPRAVLFFTGEALDEEESDEEDSDEDEDDEDADSDQDEDFDPSKAKENPECKQQ